ncbi:MAG TPA: Stk1 family PASTA domain-containing Ser/Thr kinase [Rubrobacteraceae bacterium]|nr:Stk1 family PASTA domain-containing Ser/Thr kinase [Rubrobacteraceae bacterium]
MEQLVDNRYRVVGRLGSGGMAEVYLAHDDILDRDVALKVMSGRYADDEEFVERFKREAQSAAALSHPNIVSIYDRGESENGTYYIAMEYLAGGTLKDRILQRGALPPETAVAVALQIAEALQAAHRSGVVHRDIKPHNVLVTASGDVKVGDFGIARAASSSTMTKTGSILGTAHYISPEQAMGEPVGPQSDLYSLGVVLYEMLTGVLPYDAETSIGIAMKHVNGRLVPPVEVNPEVPKGINAITVRLLAKEPEDRYADANELIRDLERVLDGLEPLAMSETQVMKRVTSPSAAPTRAFPSPPLQGKRERRRWLPALLFLLLLALLGGAAYAASTGMLQPDTEKEEAAAVTVPDLIGKTIEQARQDSGGAYGTFENERVESEEPVGTIVAQDPAAGETWQENADIYVDVSDGKEVPDITGQSRNEAKQSLEGAGFKVDEETETSSAVEEGYVIRQDPQGGTRERAEAGSTLTITVSEGPQAVTVPDLYNLTPEGANSVLVEAGLKLGNQTQQASSAVTVGSIISQTPPAQSSAKPGSSVDLVTSTGPQKITVPDVVGQDWITAAQRLRDAGLTVNETVSTTPSSRPKNEVISTDPQAGFRADPGTVITLTTSQGPPPPAPVATQTTSSEPKTTTQQPAPKQAAPKGSTQSKSKSGNSNEDD